MLRRILCSGIILMAAVIFVNAQDRAPDPTPTPYLGRAETGVEKIKRLDREHQRLQDKAYVNLYGQGNYAKSKRYSSEFRKKMTMLYRKPDKKETAILNPDKKYLQKYEEFLKDKNTGIFKLIPDHGCSENSDVINASPKCTKYNFPGAGSSYSFRLKAYRIKRLADLTFAKNSLTTHGIFNGAIFYVLGNVPIENVTLNSSGLKFLQEYKPAKNANEAVEAARSFAKGVEKNGHIYGRGVFVNGNNTFAMRSIAYRGKFKRAEEGIVYNELDFDKRRDIIVVFRIVDVGKDGSATIVWKMLNDTKAPKLKIPRGK